MDKDIENFKVYIISFLDKINEDFKIKNIESRSLETNWIYNRLVSKYVNIARKNPTTVTDEMNKIMSALKVIDEYCKEEI